MSVAAALVTRLDKELRDIWRVSAESGAPMKVISHCPAMTSFTT